MTTVKLDTRVKDRLSKIKKAYGLKSYSDTIALLVDQESSKLCYTQEGLAKEGDCLMIEGNKFTIIDITDSMVYARKDCEVIEFHKHGKIAWSARVVDED